VARATLPTLLLSLVCSVQVLNCTLLSELDVNQCEQSTECISATGAWGRCEQSRCVTTGCASNAECVAVDPRFPICQRHGGECVPLMSEGPECPASSNYDPGTMDSLTAEDLILIGAFTPSVRTPTGLSLELAVQELNANGGLPGIGAIKPVLVVECDGSMAMAAMRHLVDALGVHAIMGSLDAAALRTVVTQRDTHEPAFFLSPGDSYVQPETLSSSGEYLWYLGSDYSDVVPAYATLVKALAANIEQTSDQAAPITIASITSARDEDEALNLAVYAGLSIDGIAGPMLADDNRFLSFSLPDDAGDGRRTMLELLVQMAPDIVISFAGGVFGNPARRERSSLFRALEDVAGATGYAPYYILAPSNVEDSSLARLALDNASFRSRAVALQARPEQDATLRTALDARFEAAFPDAAALGFHVSPAVYDGLYYLAYAVAAAPTGVRGTRADRTRDGFSRITDRDGPAVLVGPEGMGTAADYLARGLQFNVSGTDGPAAFDLDEHSRPSQGKLYCWDERGTPREFATHDPKTGFVLESMPCGPEVADVVAASTSAR
jgi:hypothetical protein